MKLGNEKIITFLILGVIVQQHQVDAMLGLILGLAKFAWSAFEMFNEVHDTYSKFTTPSTADLMEKSEELAASIDSWGTKLEQKIQESMDTLLTRLPLLGEIASNADTLNKYVGKIDRFYGDFQEYIKHPDHFSDDGIERLLEVFTSLDAGDIKDTIGSIFDLVVPGRVGGIKKSLFLLLAQETQVYGLELCDTGAPPQQRIVDLYNIIMETEMRAFTMMGFGYTLRGVMEKKNLTADIFRAERGLTIRAKQYMLTVKKTMDVAALQFRRCDPRGGQERGVTFHEFERFMQAFIVQEGALVEDHVCKLHCAEYDQPTKLYYGFEGYGSEESPNTCFGRVNKCASMGYEATMCENDASNPRRYEYFESKSERAGDTSVECPGTLTNGSKVSYEGYKCDICRCICVEDQVESKSIHFVSLRERIADIDNNMVVTGLALVIENKIAQLQVMQGQLGPDGVIPEDSSVWMQPENINYVQDESMEMSDYKFIIEAEDGEDEELITGEDIAVLTYERSTFYLDTLTVPDGYVLTGVRFNTVKEKDWKPIQLEIHATSFDYLTGQLDPGSTMWLTPDDMGYAKIKGKRDQTEPDGYRSPIKSRKTVINSRPYSWMELDYTSYGDDAAQTIIPLLDAQPVTSTPLVPLGGVGLYHKSQSGYAGFLTLVLEGVNLASIIPDEV